MPLSSRILHPVASLTLAVLLLAAAPGPAQVLPKTSKNHLTPNTPPEVSAVTSDLGPAGIIPMERGFNASVVFTSQHDSNGGWSSLITPDLAYRWNRYLSADVSLPIYPSSNTRATQTQREDDPTLVRRTLVADTSLAGHLNLPALLGYTGTLSLALPTGNPADGHGAGQVTYDLNNRFEKSFHHLMPNLELGFGNSTNLVEERFRKPFFAVGKLAHLQAGFSLDLPHNLNFSSDTYEELPLTSTLSAFGAGGRPVNTSHSRGEDNGINNSLDLPLNPHTTLSTFYNRSFRNHENSIGFSVTFLLKPPPQEPATR